MKIFVLNLIFILALGTSETMGFSPRHTANSGEKNLATLEQIECLIHKNAGAELKKNYENSFTMNGHNIRTAVVVRRYGSNTYEEFFYEIQKPNNEFRIRLVINPNGNQELAVMIREDEGFNSYHACFDPDGIMLEDDPWGKNDESYTVEIFNLYKKYREIYAQKIDEINTKQQDSKKYISGQF